MKALEIQDLKKSYNNKEVLKGVSFDIDQGDFFWLLGYNGAWKTTLIGILTDLVTKNKWLVKVFGEDIDKNISKAKKYIWVVPQEFNFDMFMKVRDILLTQAWFYWVPLDEAKNRVWSILEKLNLLDKIDTPAMRLSWWMKRRLMIARALMHQPKLLILDEPTAWVDVELRKLMWEFLTELNNNGTTILLTTHYLEEAESLCNRIAIINEWEIIENANKDQLLRKLKEENVILQLNDELHSIPDGLENFNPVLVNATKLELIYDNQLYNINDIILTLNSKWIRISNITNKSNRLEQLFLKLTKKWTI